MNGPIDYEARAKARDEAMDRFLRHYNEFVRGRHGGSEWMCSSDLYGRKIYLEDDDGHQLILNLEMEDTDD